MVTLDYGIINLAGNREAIPITGYTDLFLRVAVAQVTGSYADTPGQTWGSD